jgi:dihydrofolate synthase/folylpolyglutamate synthase
MTSTDEDRSYDAVEKLRSDLGDRPVRESLDPVREQARTLIPAGESPTIIQVVGSNGKGSVVHYLENLLERSGRSTVSYVSPHLSELRERIHWNGEPLSTSEFNRLIRKLPRTLHENFTPFERLFLAALQLGVDRSTDVLILEAGMGGRWDATSALPADWTLLTSVDREHTDFLGSRRRDILREQLDQLPPETHLVAPILSPATLSEELSAMTDEKRVTTVQLKEPGDPDTLNRNLSLVLGRLLTDRSGPWLQKQLQQLNRPPGRKEILYVQNREILLDVAHSPAALREWIRFSTDQGGMDPSLYVYGCLKGKEHEENIEILREHIQPRNLWLTRPPSPRAQDPEDLCRFWPDPPAGQPRVIPDPDAVWDLLHERTPDRSTISIAGSFTLVHYFREKIL